MSISEPRSFVLRSLFSVLSLLSLFAFEEARPQGAATPKGTASSVQSERSGAWSARSNSGRVLMGTWTAVPDSATETVMGTWTLSDEQGKTLAYGGWSAAKTPNEWTGSWRAIVAGREGEFAGTWNSTVDLKVKAQFADLFEKAVQTIVSGEWRTGRYSGAWSIRAAPR